MKWIPAPTPALPPTTHTCSQARGSRPRARSSSAAVPNAADAAATRYANQLLGEHAITGVKLVANLWNVIWLPHLASLSARRRAVSSAEALDQRQVRGRTVATASAATPSSRPTKPMPSPVEALTFTLAGSSPSASASVERIAAR